MRIVKIVPIPAGWWRLLLRAPIPLFRRGLGWVFGHRLLLLNHVGRVTGTMHQTILEVVEHDAASGSYVVGSGWGSRAAWYRNVRAEPRVSIVVGRQKIPVTAVALNEDEGAVIFTRYAARHRRIARHLLPRVLGVAVDGSADDFMAVGQRMPFIRFVPRR